MRYVADLSRTAERLLERIRALHAANCCAYGARRVSKALERAGERVGRCRVERRPGSPTTATPGWIALAPPCSPSSRTLRMGVARVLTHLGATADVVRGANTGHWRTSRPGGR